MAAMLCISESITWKGTIKNNIPIVKTHQFDGRQKRENEMNKPRSLRVKCAELE